MEDRRLSGMALQVGGGRRMGDRERAEAIQAVYLSVLGVLGKFLDAPAWIRDGVDGLERGRRRAKKRTR